MSPRGWVLLAGALVAAALAAAGWYYWGPARMPAGQPPLTALTTEDLPQFRAGFNQAAGSVRVVALLSPT